MDVEGIRDAWVKASSSKRRDNRLEHLSWRVWHMKRMKDEVRREELKVTLDSEQDSDLMSPNDQDDDIQKIVG